MGDRKCMVEEPLFIVTFQLPIRQPAEANEDQYDNVLFCYFVLSTVLSGLGRCRMVAELSQDLPQALLLLVQNISL